MDCSNKEIKIIIIHGENEWEKFMEIPVHFRKEAKNKLLLNVTFHLLETKW